MNTQTRSLQLDMWRGIACILMICYHFCYDLNYLKIASFDFYHNPFWLGLRILIVSLFLVIVGISLHLATSQKIQLRSYLKRLAILLTCALLISIASFMLFHERFIFFGILHFITVASVLGLLFRGKFWLNLATGSALLSIGFIGGVQHQLFNQPLLQWIGLMTHKPYTEDYVPLLPWFGLVLLGMALGQLKYNQKIIYKNLNSTLGLRVARMGQHSLLIYMLHQPILLGVLWVIYYLFTIF